METLTIIPTFEIYVFWYSRQTEGQTDGDINPGGAFVTYRFLQVKSHDIGEDIIGPRSANSTSQNALLLKRMIFLVLDQEVDLLHLRLPDLYYFMISTAKCCVVS